MSSHADRIIDLYQRHAQGYIADRAQVPWCEGLWLARFAELLPAGGSVLDLGCGCAEPIARHLIAQGFELTGVDTAAGLIAHGRDRYPAHAWLVADMRDLALGRRFHGLLAWDSFFHLAHDDQRGMFAVFRRHAAPGAALMFTSGPAEGIALGVYRGEPLFHASLDPQAYRHLLAANGFLVRAHRAEDPDCGGHTVWLAQRED